MGGEGGGKRKLFFLYVYHQKLVMGGFDLRKEDGSVEQYHHPDRGLCGLHGLHGLHARPLQPSWPYSVVCSLVVNGLLRT